MGELLNSGGSFLSETVIVNAWSVKTVPSDARRATLWIPISLFDGVPESTAVPSPLSLNVSQVGNVVAAMTSASPSGSVTLTS